MIERAQQSLMIATPTDPQCEPEIPKDNRFQSWPLNELPPSVAQSSPDPVAPAVEPQASDHPAPKLEDFEMVRDYTDALAMWTMKEFHANRMSEGRLSCIFDCVEFATKQKSVAPTALPSAREWLLEQSKIRAKSTFHFGEFAEMLEIYADLHAAHVSAQQEAQHLQNKLIADAARESWELQPCGHMKKYQVFGIPGAVTCQICEHEATIQELRQELEVTRKKSMEWYVAWTELTGIGQRLEASEQRVRDLSEGLEAVVEAAITDADTCSICSQDITEHSDGCVILLADSLLSKEGKGQTDEPEVSSNG
jgi:hypothetical protein